MAQDQWTLQEKVKESTGAQAATAGPCCSYQQDSPCSCRDDPGAHGNEQGGAKQNRTGAVECGQQAWHGKAAGK